MARFFTIRKPDDHKTELWSHPTIKPTNVEVVGYCSYNKDHKMTFDLSQVPYYHPNQRYKLPFDLNHVGDIVDNFEPTKLDEFLHFIINCKKEKNKIEGHNGNFK